MERFPPFHLRCMFLRKQAIKVPSALMYKVDPNLFLGMAAHLP